MVGLIIISAFVGLIAGFVINTFLGWIVFATIFVLGLIPALISDFIRGQVEYAQDCAYDRQLMSDLSADRRAEEHEAAADRRADKRRMGITQVYNDNRKISFSTGERHDPDALV